jgi:hypothetical protein
LAAKPDETPKGAHLVGQTASSDTYALADGKFMVRTHTHPVNWQDAGGVFHVLDLALAKGTDGRWRPKSAPPGASFADSAPAGGSKVSAGRTVRFDSGGWSVGLDPSGAPALSAAVLSGSASYRLGGGVSLVEQASPDGGVKEAIRLDAVPSGSADVSYTFALDVAGVAPSTDSNGVIVFKTPDGTVMASIPGGVAVDSAVPAPAQSPVSVALSGGAGAWALTVSAPGSWLADPTRVYPVVIDPSLQAGRGGAAAQEDAFVASVNPTTTWNGAAQYYSPLGNYVDDVGVFGTAQYKTFLRWNLSPLIATNKGIISASLSAKVLGQNPTGGTQYSINALSQDFSSSTVTWNNQPAAYGSGSLISAASIGGQATVDLTSTVTSWASGQYATFSGWAGVVLFPYSATGYSNFGAAEATGGADPTLQVTYADVAAATIVSPPIAYVACSKPDHSANTCISTVGTASPTITIAQPGSTAGHTVQ